jgi:Holliday junction DNA helicase RuvA
VIASLNGELLARRPDSVVIEVGGVGFEVLMSNRDISKLPDPGKQVRILTKLQVRDDAFVLFGFLSESGKRLFEKLTSVTGVGPKVALSVLSTYSPEELAAYVVAQDVAAIQRVPGVGKKMASRLVLELKDSLEGEAQLPVPLTPTRNEAAFSGVTEALLSMGFTATEAELALKGAPEQASETVLLQYALKRLGA